MREQHHDVDTRRTTKDMFEAIGFSDLAMLAAQGAARVGARQLLEYDGASPDKLQTVFKQSEGMTPVTVADLASEDIILRIISNKLFPDHRVNAEESGGSGGESNLIWHIDPLDGTRSFTREHRTSTVGIALYDGETPVLSSICRPFQRELLVAEAGKGAFVFPLSEQLAIVGDGRKLSVSDKTELNGGIVFMDGVMTKNTVQPTLDFLQHLLTMSNGKFDLRTPGTNIGQQAAVAMGQGELSLTTAVGGFFDLAPGALMIKEAGGEFVGVDGKPINIGTQVAIGGNPEIVRQALPFLKQAFQGYKGFK